MMATRSLLRSMVIGLILLVSVVPCRSRAVHSPLDLQRGMPRQLPDAVTVALSLQGGAKATSRKNAKSTAISKQEVQVQVQASPRTRNAAIVVGTGMTSYLLWVYRARWMGLFDKEKLLEKTLGILHHLDEQPKHISYSLYMLGMAVWEALGLSTIPVETASGMVFGWAGLYLSAIGKLAGAVVAFCLARYGVLAAFIQEKLSKNQVLKLLEDSAASNPLRVAFLVKLSCFPETLKNYGSSLLLPIRLWMFTFATMVHGWTFSALWTYLGVDTAMRLKDPSIPVDGKLQILLTMAIVNGVVVSPLAMAFGIKTLKKQTQQVTTSEKKKGLLRRLKKEI
jgi:uncharacterized membrane protein YdjX (TVP38/TMEM64 family)